MTSEDQLSYTTQRMIYDELEKIFPHGPYDHGPWDILAPSRLVYPDLTERKKRKRS